MRKLSIKMRLYAAFALVLLIMTSVVALGVLTGNTAIDGIQSLGGRYDIAGDAMQLDRDFVALRRDIRQFRDEPDEAGRQNLLDKADHIFSDIAKVSEHLGDEPDVKVLQSSMEEYRQILSQLSQLMIQTAGFSDVLDRHIVGMDSLLAEKESALAQKARLDLWKIRLAGEHYFETGSAEDYRKVQSLFALLRETADPLPELRTSLSLAEQDFASMVKMADQSVGHFRHLADLGNRMTALAAGLRQKNIQAAEVIASNVMADVRHSRDGSLLGTILAAGLAFSAAALIARSIAAPIGKMTIAMGDLARGNLFVDIPSTIWRDEVGAMSQAMQVFKANMLSLEKMRQDQEAAKIAAQQERSKALLHMAQMFERNVATVLQTVAGAANQLHGAANSMSHEARQAGCHAGSVASAAEQTNAGVQAVATASEELAASIREISRQVNQSTLYTQGAVDEVDIITDLAHELRDAAACIGQVVGLIRDIAGQTNLLALNATIESARAGEAGKGFAVVAGEVKMLAGQTAQATSEITDKVQQIQDVASKVVEAIEQIGKTVDNMSRVSQGIAAAIEQQEAATSEIARTIEQVANGAQTVSESIVVVSQASASTAENSGFVLSAANDLHTQSDQLSDAVDGFLKTIRAA